MTSAFLPTICGCYGKIFAWQQTYLTELLWNTVTGVRWLLKLYWFRVNFKPSVKHFECVSISAKPMILICCAELCISIVTTSVLCSFLVHLTPLLIKMILYVLIGWACTCPFTFMFSLVLDTHTKYSDKGCHGSLKNCIYTLMSVHQVLYKT